MHPPKGLTQFLQDGHNRYYERSSAYNEQSFKKGKQQRKSDMERSPAQHESYVLRGGQAGAERLRLVDRIKRPTPEQLLNKAGLQAGLRMLDIGCGAAVTPRMAALVRPEGEVVSADFDQSILRLAQRQAEDLNVLQAPLPPSSPSSSTQ